MNVLQLCCMEYGISLTRCS